MVDLKVAFLFALITMTTCDDMAHDLLKTYFGTIEREHPYTDIKVEGYIPEWLSGYFLHQTAGSYGNQSNPKVGEKLTHTFDGVGAVSSFKFNGGHVQYSIRYYVTQLFKIFDYYSRNMDRSKVAWGTTFSPFDQQQFKKWEDFHDYPDDNPNVVFWKIGDKVEAMSEATAGVQFDLDTLQTLGTYQFKDDNFGMPPYMAYLNNPAHEHYGGDGVTIYSAVAMYNMSDVSKINVTRMLYKVVDDTRIPVALFHEAGPFNLSECTPGSSYPDMDDRGGYMHSFCMTENYFVMPTSTYKYDVCSIFNEKLPPEPFFKTKTEYSETSPTRFVVISRSTRNVVGEFSTPDGLFVTHQLNSYEKDGMMYLDMLTYRGDAYGHFYIKNLLKGSKGLRTRVERFVVNTSDWSLTERKELFPKRDHDLVEFSTINYQSHSGKPYKYAYMIGLDPAPNVLIKLNVDTGEANYWGPYDDLIPGEPIFVEKPGSSAEDDGVILANVLDTNTGKGMVVVLDGKSFAELGRAISPELMPFGFHSKFIEKAFDEGTVTLSRHTTCVVFVFLCVAILVFMKR
ncbi:beta,beta-carotene 15,15'-dioxygenase-like [Ptychodera flava]|uniref:beta,beta-carotene 15,15'-dioxygenase-like n=1 Tax=Ptychodera flava TaxID=63121 RepID=UPI00396A4B0B